MAILEKFAFLFAAGGIIAAAGVVVAAVSPIDYTHVSRDTPDLENVLLSASASARTFTLPVTGHTQATVYVKYTDGGSGGATSITMTCLAGPDGDIVYKVPILQDGATQGDSDSTHHRFRWELTDSENIRWLVGPLNDKNLSCTVGAEGSLNGDDLIESVKTRLGVI